MSSRRKGLLIGVKLALTLALLGWLFLGDRFDWSLLSSVNSGSSLALLGGAGLLLILSQAVAAQRWCAIARVCGLELRLWDAFAVNYVGLLFNNFILGSQGGDLVRIGLVCRAYPERKADASAVLLLDRILGVVGLCVAAAGLSVLGWSQLSYAARWGGIGMCGLGLTLLVGLFMALALPLTSLPGGKLVAAKIPSLVGAHELLRTLRHRRLLVLYTLALSTAVHGLCLAALALCAQALGLQVGWLPVMWGSTLTMLLNLVPLTPGNLGVTEMLSGEIFLLLGADGGAALFACYRVLTALASLPAAVLFFRDVAGVRSSRPVEPLGEAVPVLEPVKATP